MKCSKAYSHFILQVFLTFVGLSSTASIQTPSSLRTSTSGFSVDSSPSTRPDSRFSNLSSTTSVSTSSQKSPAEKIFYCTVCFQIGKHTCFRRKNDWKRHEENFHHTQKEWLCDCGLAFGRVRDFTEHHSSVHTGSTLSQVSKLGIDLLPTVFYACGFQGCKGLFKSWDERCDHVASHMKANPTSAQWDYSVEVTNLLRQPELRKEWKDLLSQRHGPDKLNWPSFSWDPVRARNLHRKLQCQDFRPSIQSLLHSAYILGLPNVIISGGQELQFTLDTPIKNFRLEDFSSEELDAFFMQHQNSSPQTRYQFLECTQPSISSMTTSTSLQHHIPDQTAYAQPSASFNTSATLISPMDHPVATTFNTDPNSSLNATPFQQFTINNPVDGFTEDEIFSGAQQDLPPLIPRTDSRADEEIVTPIHTLHGLTYCIVEPKAKNRKIQIKNPFSRKRSQSQLGSTHETSPVPQVPQMYPMP